MGYVPYVGLATHRRATVRIHLYFKRLMIKQMICIKKKWVITANGIRAIAQPEMVGACTSQ
jgi:hypothetical protein